MAAPSTTYNSGSIAELASRRTTRTSCRCGRAVFASDRAHDQPGPPQIASARQRRLSSTAHGDITVERLILLAVHHLQVLRPDRSAWSEIFVFLMVLASHLALPAASSSASGHAVWLEWNANLRLDCARSQSTMR